MENYIGVEEIKKVLPHRYPFLLLDRILEVAPGERCVALKNLTANEEFFQGHFPGKPVMPGVLIVEALAQAGAYAVLSLPEYAGRIAFFAAADKIKFRGMVIPGDILTLSTEIIKLKSSAGIGAGMAAVNGKKVCEGEFTFMIN